ncbi:hypothetical protein BKG87_22270 [Mycobacteroides chelonae]|nr:hypothetical protein BKG87_22270 [Mycobacteroides chelonae]
MSEIEISEVVDAEFVEPEAMKIWFESLSLHGMGGHRRLRLDIKIEGPLPSADQLGAAIAGALRDTRVFR